MMTGNEIDRLRLEVESLQSQIDTLLAESQTGSLQTILVQTKAVGTYPSTPNAFYVCDVLKITGIPTEGEAPTFTAVDRTVVCYNLGAAVPPQGTKRLAHLDGNQWVFTY